MTCATCSLVKLHHCIWDRSINPVKSALFCLIWSLWCYFLNPYLLLCVLCWNTVTPCGHCYTMIYWLELGTLKFIESSVDRKKVLKILLSIRQQHHSRKKKNGLIQTWKADEIPDCICNILVSGIAACEKWSQFSLSCKTSPFSFFTLV